MRGLLNYRTEFYISKVAWLTNGSDSAAVSLGSKRSRAKCFFCTLSARKSEREKQTAPYIIDVLLSLRAAMVRKKLATWLSVNVTVGHVKIL